MGKVGGTQDWGCERKKTKGGGTPKRKREVARGRTLYMKKEGEGKLKKKLGLGSINDHRCRGGRRRNFSKVS